MNLEKSVWNLVWLYMYLGFNRFIGDCLVCETDYFRRNPIPRGIFDENFGSLKKPKVYIEPTPDSVKK